MANKTLLINCCTGKLVPLSYQLRCFSNSLATRKHYDIAIAGGGMVGTAMACAIGKNSKLIEKKVLLLEGGPQKRTPKKTANDVYSNRVVSLNPGTKKYFQTLGVWKHIEDVRFQTVKKMQVWDACSDALITFNEDLADDVSYIVENDVIMSALETTLQELNRIEVQYESKVKETKLSNGSQPARLQLEGGETITCNLLIGADGANSQIRGSMGQQYLSWSYKQMGVVATLKLSEPTANVVAWQRFLPSGPIALLPLTDELSSLVWSTDTDSARKLLALSEEAFVDAVNDAFWKPAASQPTVSSATASLDRLLNSLHLQTRAVRQLPPSVSSVQTNSRAAFPLGFGHATRYVAPGVALIGDAAHRVHPLAGQGVNLGFGDIECLTKLLAEAVYSGSHLGSLNLLSDYESIRQRRNFPTMVAIDLLQKLYGTSFTPVVLLRSLGLQLTHSLTPLKKAIINHAAT